MAYRAQVLTDEGDLDQETRGESDPGGQRQVSAAVVIGVGGSGIQTVARVRSAVRSERPDQSVRASIQFLGVDAVEPTKQNPPLPPGVRLGAGEFLNLTEVPFDASMFVRAQLQADPLLKLWWDPDYTVPAGPLTEGLKRERMLGRLAFFKESRRTTTAIARAMDQAISIGRLTELGDAGGADVPSVPVYIVASSCGGTGSAGFLEVVFSVWSAARNRGLVPKIYAFVYLPGAFEAEVLRTQMGAVAAEAQRANAYAFFRELDHFLIHSSELGPQMGQDVRHGGPQIPDGQLLHQVYLMDGLMQGIGTINRVTDLYEITAESIFQFLLTDGGRPLVGVDAANTDQALAEVDRWDKPRRYCSLGIARVLFPGDTYRQHLAMRYVDWIIDDSFLASPADIVQYVRDHPTSVDLDDRLPGLFGAVRRYEPEDEVLDFLSLADRIPSELAAKPTPEEARKFRNHIELDSTTVVKSMQRTLDVRARDTLRNVERTVTDALLGSGEGVPFGIEVMRRVRKVCERALAAAVAANSAEAAAASEAENQVGQLMEELTKAASRRPHERLLAVAGSVIGKSRTGTEIGQQLGLALQAWAHAIHDHQLAESETSLLEEIRSRSVELRQELERAQERLRVLSSRARDHWQWDELLGKDAGPIATSVLIPSDVVPEVEDSRFAKKWFADFTAEYRHVVNGEGLVEFVDRWVKEASNRGFLSLGSDDPDERRKAELTLLAALDRDAEERALHVGAGRDRQSRLPATVEEAAKDASEESRLHDGIKSLEDLSKHVCWSWDEGRFQLSRPVDDASRALETRPSVTSVVMYDKSAAKLVKGEVERRKLVTMSDPERIVALSVEWAVPVHALHAIDQWRAAYEQVQRRRMRSPGTIPPVHIDQRWGDSLEQLSPQYGEHDVAAEVIAKALIVGDLLEGERAKATRGPARRQEVGPVSSLFDRARGNQALSPLGRHETEDRWVGRLIDVVEGGALRVRKGSVGLGESWQDLVDRTAEESPFQHSTNEVTALVIKELGAGVVAGAARSTLERLTKIANNRRLAPRERGAVEHIVEGLLDFLTDLETRIIAGQ